jgi:hypothetical protein
MSRERDIDFIVYTSVADGLSSAAHASPATIKRAIAHEKRNGKRSALIQGLELELRRRQRKPAARES